MFETTFSYASATPLPSNLNIAATIELLHDFETVIKLSPDCRSCKQVPPPKNSCPKTNGTVPATTFWEVEDDLPFMPKRLWTGGVRYTADFLPTRDGCDITVHAPGGFTSTNHWRLLRETAPMGPARTGAVPQGKPENDHFETISGPDLTAALVRVGTKDLAHADTDSGTGWYVEIISDARCPRTFAGIIKGFLKNSHSQLEHAFIDRLKVEARTPAKRPPAVKRPTLSRRRSSVL